MRLKAQSNPIQQIQGTSLPPISASTPFRSPPGPLPFAFPTPKEFLQPHPPLTRGNIINAHRTILTKHGPGEGKWAESLPHKWIPKWRFSSSLGGHQPLDGATVEAAQKPLRAKGILNCTDKKLNKYQTKHFKALHEWNCQKLHQSKRTTCVSLLLEQN